MPYNKPAYRIVIDGKDISPTVRNRLESLRLTDNRGFEADMLEINLDDTDGRLSIPPRGARVQLWIGWEGLPLEDKGEYVVDEIEHSGPPDIMAIRARSADLRTGISTKKERSWHQQKLGDIVRSIAAQNDLIPVVGKQFEGVIVTHIDQTAETDLNLLQRLAEEHDAISTIKAGRLLFIAQGQATTASGQPLPELSITRSIGDGHQFSVADRAGYTAVRAYYNDIHKAERASVLVNEENTTEDGEPLAVGGVKELSHIYVRKATAERAVREQWRKINRSGNRQEYTGVRAYYWTDKRRTKKSSVIAGKDSPPPAPPVTEASAENVKTLRHVYATKANALRAAQSEYRRLRRGMATFSITLALGRPDVSPESPVSVFGFKPEIDSTKWICVRAIHAINSGGFTTSVDLEVRPVDLEMES
ncbi:MAG: phage late control D family protein [Novosphingobium sp.]